ncbi:HMG domain-containing protein 3 isoform X2 [Oryzias latipes]|uniref:HMG-box containing 3 n=2 Tax=Oryzias latipes TaxID=8090 RepID=A0A3B3HW93_ORYLA|nr:HMG domain-containing protein 3 isoform X2 [Oryzias latipes]XP_023814989.1 HMG domain-containing protein 3 isoform X2 [Oryzias latipes]
MDKMEVSEVVEVTEEVTSTQTKGTTPKKRTSTHQEVNVEKPKKPRSAYLLYYFDIHQIMQLESPNLPQSEVNKRISEGWKRLSVSERSYYLEKAKMEKDGVESLSQSSCKHLPGFRKILPRATCFLLPNGNSLTHQPGGGLSVKSENVPEACSPSTSVTSEVQFLSPEVELTEHHIVTEEATEETAAGFADFTVGGVALKGNEAQLMDSCYNQGEATQVVTVLPTQKLLEPKCLEDAGSVHPVMMISVGTKSEQTVKPIESMSVKTYTRRGRGRCPNPGCSFVYVTRHKPSACPECGSFLGGKWTPARTGNKEAAVLQVGRAGEHQPEKSSKGADQEGSAYAGRTKTSGNSEESKSQRSSKKQPSTESPPGGSSTELQTQMQKVKARPKVPIPPRQNRSSSIVQKRPVRPILPAPYNTGGTLIQIFTVPADKGKFHDKSSLATAPQDNLSGLKPSTLKQLGQPVPPTTANQNSAGKRQLVSSLKDGGLNILSVVPLEPRTVSSFDLGLSTARGRGRCRNPACDYMYKNRHKPAKCPKCDCELTQKKSKAKKSETLLDPYKPLTPGQIEIQRQNTVQLLRTSLQIPESDSDLQETLSLIEELNDLKVILLERGNGEDGTDTKTLLESGWPQMYESAATHCGLCNYPLFKGGKRTIAESEDCWLLTDKLLQAVTLHVKVCLNPQCLALHSFTDLHPGLFNVGNRLLVSINLFLKIRNSLKQGQSPSQAAATALDHNPNHTIHNLCLEDSSQIQELLLSGYWAFESLTVRDYNDMICGVCGVAPKIEISQRDTSNVLELKSVEFTWPTFLAPDEVLVDDFWLTMESEAIEQAAFPADIPITRVDASIIAPFIPPLMRNLTVINTEKDKLLSQTEQPSGDPSVLVRLIHDGLLRLDKIEDHNEDELRGILERCGISVSPGCTKKELLASLVNFYTRVYSGLPSAAQPSSHLTAGKLSKVCPHKVVSSSKYLVRGETARDHVDLLLSSRFWPPVYVCDCAHEVALCTDLQYPNMATQMWGRNQGSFCDPFEKPECVSCEELQEQTYHTDLSLSLESQQTHPITKSSSCWTVHPPPGANQKLPPAEHHSMALCRQLEPYIHAVSEAVTAKVEENATAEKDKPNQILFNNPAYYYLYNRLVDYLSSKDIVSQQITHVLKACQPGEVVIRDSLYRLGVAQINTKEEVKGMEGQTEEEGSETHEGCSG